MTTALNPRPAAIRRRRICSYLSTFGAEIVRFEFPDGRRASVFCKYGPGYRAPSGHLRGVSYEADIYATVLSRLDVNTPRFHGTWLDVENGRTLLFLAYLPRATPLHQSADRTVLPRAAAMLGRFHRSSGNVPQLVPSNRFDEDFYRRWEKRVPMLAAAVEGPPWLAALGEGCPHVTELLSIPRRVVVHGELFTGNALVHRGEIYFIDWETAALGAGELDLAALTIGNWPRDRVTAAERAYIYERFGDQAPPGFAKTLAAARIYVLLELLGTWLEDAPDRLPRHSESSAESWVFDQLREAGLGVGLL